MDLLSLFRPSWKSRHNHFVRHSDVKPKDERRPTVNELSNQKYVLQKVNGWKVSDVFVLFFTTGCCEWHSRGTSLGPGFGPGQGLKVLITVYKPKAWV